MTHNANVVSQEVIDQVIEELERLAEDARNKWSIPKRNDPNGFAAWHGRELGYRNALQVLADAGLVPKHGGRR